MTNLQLTLEITKAMICLLKPQTYLAQIELEIRVSVGKLNRKMSLDQEIKKIKAFLCSQSKIKRFKHLPHFLINSW